MTLRTRAPESPPRSSVRRRLRTLGLTGLAVILASGAQGADELGLEGPGVAAPEAAIFTAADLGGQAPAAPALAPNVATAPDAVAFSGPISDPLIVTAVSPRGAPPPFVLPRAVEPPPGLAAAAPAGTEASVVVAITPAALRAALAERLADPALRGRAGAAQRKAREEIAQAYAARGDAPLWIADGTWTPAARGAFERLRRADEDGLDLGSARLAALGEPTLEAELQFSESVFAYARQAAGGRVEPWRVSSIITAKPPQVEASAALGRVGGAASASEAGQALRDFNPPHPGYLALRDKLAEIRRERPKETQAPIPVGPTLKVGMRDERVPLIRSRLGLGPSDGESAEPMLYDLRVASAVKDFQRGAGLPASGQLTPRTVAALSGGEPSRLENEVLANMERWRWLPRDLGETRVEVNIPDYALAMKEGERTVLAARVVVGKPGSPTPVFSDRMRYLVVNPSWTMPPSILAKEALPNLAADPDYYTKRGYEVIWRNGKVTVRQPPGERNALGAVKFMFPNDHAVYLHDTPSRALFSQPRRAYSHGCVRVDQPFRLAEAVLNGRYSEAALKRMVGSKERSIPLAEPLPIHLTYFTAKVEEDGRLALSDDIYGYSRRLRAAMGLEGAWAAESAAAESAPRKARKQEAAAKKPRPPQARSLERQAEIRVVEQPNARLGWWRWFGGGDNPRNEADPTR